MVEVPYSSNGLWLQPIVALLLVVIIADWILPLGVHTVQVSGQHVYQSMPKLHDQPLRGCYHNSIFAAYLSTCCFCSRIFEYDSWCQTQLLHAEIGRFILDHITMLGPTTIHWNALPSCKSFLRTCHKAASVHKVYIYLCCQGD